eukprot:g14437.t1
MDYYLSSGSAPAVRGHEDAGEGATGVAVGTARKQRASLTYFTEYELGQTPFGRIFVVSSKRNPSQRFVLKTVRKADVAARVASLTLSSSVVSDETRAATTTLASEKIQQEVLQPLLLDSAHPHWCRLVEYFETETEFELLFEEAEGGEISDFVEKLNKSKSWLQEQTAALYVRQVLQALAWLHYGRGGGAAGRGAAGCGGGGGTSATSSSPVYFAPSNAAGGTPTGEGRTASLMATSSSSSHTQSHHGALNLASVQLTSKLPEARVKLADAGLAEFMSVRDVLDSILAEQQQDGNGENRGTSCCTRHDEDVVTAGTTATSTSASADNFASLFLATASFASGGGSSSSSRSPFHIDSSANSTSAATVRFLDADGWEGRTQASRDFVRALLTPDARKRLTVAQALNHEWLSEKGIHFFKPNHANNVVVDQSSAATSRGLRGLLDSSSTTPAAIIPKKNFFQALMRLAKTGAPSQESRRKEVALASAGLCLCLLEMSGGLFDLARRSFNLADGDGDGYLFVMDAAEVLWGRVLQWDESASQTGGDSFGLYRASAYGDVGLKEALSKERIVELLLRVSSTTVLDFAEFLAALSLIQFYALPRLAQRDPSFTLADEESATSGSGQPTSFSLEAVCSSPFLFGQLQNAAVGAVGGGGFSLRSVLAAKGLKTNIGRQLQQYCKLDLEAFVNGFPKRAVSTPGELASALLKHQGRGRTTFAYKRKYEEKAFDPYFY